MPTQVLIRPARPADLDRCLQLDRTLETQHVWQMKHREEGEAIHISFQTIRLPRPIRVDYPRSNAELRADLEQLEGVLVAEAGEVLLGFAQMTAITADKNAFLRNLAVDAPFRRHRIGRALLERAKAWAQLNHANHIMLEATTRSYPAIRFMLSAGLIFCGFNDRYYTNQEIALFFGQNL